MFTVHHFWLLMILSCSTFNVLLAAWLWKCLRNQALTLFPSWWPVRWHGFSDRYSSDSSGRSGWGKTHWTDSVMGGMVMQYMNNMMVQCSVLLRHVVSFSKNFPTFFDISLEIILAACIAINSWQGSLKTNRFRIRSSISSFQVEKVPNPVDLDEEGKDRSFLQELFFVDPRRFEKRKALRGVFVNGIWFI